MPSTPHDRVLPEGDGHGPRRPWTTPTVQSLGTLADLTRGGSGDGADVAMEMSDIGGGEGPGIPGGGGTGGGGSTVIP